jgi:fatty-acyl-CoA synthase
MIIRGGLNLYPAEIEAALQEHPAIETAAVIGVPDEKWGEEVGAVVRLRAGFDRPSVAELTGFLRDQMAAHKAPHYWTFVEELPMTSTGKIQKFVLRDLVVKGDLVFDEVRPATATSEG